MLCYLHVVEAEIDTLKPKFSFPLLLALLAFCALLLTLPFYLAKEHRDRFRSIAHRGAIVQYENQPPPWLLSIANIDWGPWFDTAAQVSFYVNLEGDMFRIGTEILTPEDARQRLLADKTIVQANAAAKLGFYLSVDESLPYQDALVNEMLEFGVTEFGVAGGASWSVYEEEWDTAKKRLR